MSESPSRLLGCKRRVDLINLQRNFINAKLSTPPIPQFLPKIYIGLLEQKQDTFMRPLLDQRAKEGKDKKVVFDAGFTKPNCKCKWFFRKDVSTIINLLEAN